jgi:hypothetical protein
MNNKLRGMWEEVMMVYFKVPEFGCRDRRKPQNSSMRIVGPLPGFRLDNS